MKILIDSDACPVKDILLDVASRYNVELVFICSLSHHSDFYEKNQLDVILVDNVSQSADMAIINKADKKDIVVTGDYGLAALALSIGAHAISFDGKIFSNDSIDNLLYKRHLSMKTLKSGGRFKGPQKRRKLDDITFKASLEKLIKNENY